MKNTFNDFVSSIGNTPLIKLKVASELTGCSFTKDGQRLYFNSQRGKDGRGITYEIKGNFRKF